MEPPAVTAYPEALKQQLSAMSAEIGQLRLTVAALYAKLGERREPVSTPQADQEHSTRSRSGTTDRSSRLLLQQALRRGLSRLQFLRPKSDRLSGLSSAAVNSVARTSSPGIGTKSSRIPAKAVSHVIVNSVVKSVAPRSKGPETVRVKRPTQPAQQKVMWRP
nr:hypothetical protein BaRGS_004316 [Batillaria attramentaria]